MPEPIQGGDPVRWYDLTIRFGVVGGEVVIENAWQFTEEVSKRVAEILPVKYVDSVVLQRTQPGDDAA